jgi:hypothetical protein
MHSGKKWGATAELLQGRTQLQCYNRWHDVVGPSIARTPGRAGRRASDEVIKPKGAIQTHGDKKLDTTGSLPAATTHADADPVKHTRARGLWTPVEDATLNSEVTSAHKKKYSKD